MILAEHRQQQSRENDVTVPDVPPESPNAHSESRLERWQHQEDGGSDRQEAVSIGIEDTVARYQQSGNIVISHSGDDTSSIASSTRTSSSDAEIEDTPIDELEHKGWQPQALAAPQLEMTGIPLPGSEPSIYRDITVKNSSVLHFGSRSFYKGPFNITQIINTNPIAEEKSNPDKPPNGTSESAEDACETAEGPKLSTGSSQLLQPQAHRGVAEWCTTRRCTFICAISLVLLVIIILAVWLANGSGTAFPSKPHVPVWENDTSVNNDPTISGVRIVSRIDWVAQPPVAPPNKLKIIPPPYVIISHTATEFCFTQSQCVLTVRVTQNFHIESRGWDDIAYNFLVGGDGNVYEGRGWDVEGAHTFNYNAKSIGLAFIGTFKTQRPTKAQVYAALKLIEYGVENGKISKDYKLLGARQCGKTESPGDALYDIIKTWDHWSPTP